MLVLNLDPCVTEKREMEKIIWNSQDENAITVRPQTERFLGQKIPLSAQNSSVGVYCYVLTGKFKTRHVQLEVYCYLLSDPFSLRPSF